MVNLSGNKVVQKIVAKFFLAKGFFVNMDVYFQNMAIRSCDYASQGVIISDKKKSVSLIRLSVFHKNSLIRRYTSY